MLKSRKYISAIAVALLAAINDAMKLGISENTIMLIAGIIGTFIVGESAIDAASALGQRGEAKPSGGEPAAPSAPPATHSPGP